MKHNKRDRIENIIALVNEFSDGESGGSAGE